MSERYDPKFTTIVCTRCDGDGEYEIPQAGGGVIVVPCQTCNGLGVERPRQGEIFGEKIVHAYEVLENIDEEEFDLLTAGNREIIDRILQCGVIDLNDGTWAKSKFWDFFDAQSTTRANLIALLA